MKIKTAWIATNERSLHQLSFGGAFARGLERHGIRCTYGHTTAKQADLLVLWSTRNQPMINLQLARGGVVCILERGYIGDRFTWTSVSFGGGLNGRGVFRGPFTDGSRWDQHFAALMKPWRDVEDGYALILQQVGGDMSLRGVDIQSFYKHAATAFPEHRIRAHPNKRPCHGSEYGKMLTSLQADLAGARLAVTWNSNSGVDAVLAGVPTVAMDKGSMAWDVSGHFLSTPPKPDRLAWAHAMAWKQWLREEFESGYCWEHVRG
jgi:hypothetical protein